MAGGFTSRQTIGIAIVAVGAVVLLAGALLAGLKFMGGSDAGSEPPPESVAAMESVIERVGQALRDPEVIEAARSALAGGSVEALRPALRSAAEVNVIEVRVFSPPLEDIELGRYPEPDFAVLHMLIEARRHGLASAEAHYAGSANENLAFAATIPEAGDGADAPAGYLFVRLPLSVVARRIGSAEGRQWLALQQDDRVVASAGELPQQLEADNTYPLAGSQLRLLTGRTGLFDGVALSVAIGIVLGGVLLLIFGLWLWRKADSPAVPAPPPQREESEPTKRAESRPSAEDEKAAAPKQDLPDWMLDQEQSEAEDGPFADKPEPAEQPDGVSKKSTEAAPGDDPSFDVPDLDEILEQIEAEEPEADESPDLSPEAAPATEPSDELNLDESDTDLPGDEFELEDEERSRPEEDEQTAELEISVPDEADDAESDQAPPDEAEDRGLDFAVEPSDETDTATGDQAEQASESASSELDLDFAFSDSFGQDKDEEEDEDEGGPEQSASTEPEPALAPAESKEPERSEALPADDEPQPLQAAIEAPGGLYLPGEIIGTFERELTSDSATAIGRALGSMLHEQGHGRIAVARDGRVSGPILLSALIRGLRNSGIDVIEIGAVPTPLLWFAAAELADGCGAMVTASHEPADRNGFRIHIGGRALDGAAMRELAERVERDDAAENREEGDYEQQDIRDRYAERLSAGIELERSLKVVVDCGNGIGGTVIPELVEALGAEVIPLYCDVDGSFPNHLPDPSSSEALEDLRLCVRNFQADLGIAFDGDADRLVVVASNGEIVWTDQLLMLLARDGLGRHPGATVVFDARCSGHLPRWIERSGGEAVMTAAGELAVAEKLQALEALLGAEREGHFIVAEGWYAFEDAIHAAARLLALFAADARATDEMVAELPIFTGSPELVVRTEFEESQTLLERLAREADFGEAKVARLGGVRVDWEDGWGLARIDLETGHLVLRFGGDDAAALGRVRSRFREQLLALEPDLKLPY